MTRRFIRRYEIPEGATFTTPPAVTIEFDYVDGYTERPLDPDTDQVPVYGDPRTWA